MSHLYITGHSLGGYLAQWVQSEIIDGALPWVESFAVTFNAPGFNPLMQFIDNTYKVKVINKLANDKLKKYDGLIINHRIKQDVISGFGDDLGTVYHYDIKTEGGPAYYHDIKRFREVDLQ
ncbi:hypothetical protein [Bacillus cytotoxicus]|uniref:hypothetical protein n=1 Tax=Bacillus cytotoxicus TaxID=580165 RepID=UPI001EF57764|nr:hypothetical protein [Bacillus cytotoxicus]MDH2859569.1 hypothetical protein [Bacillus cytotoxicus]MDH2867454.1 hypothetical protein [Bacillus cytotoxicus]MDH2871538.1 hypothetical protein [Bacillus cytotoxicus]MDH2876157.1 hypothetical protein [Bacillus cytotoxicus]MDH2892369.1 hypothetical protein [Bacillus cytotoxicus]